jgi:hypothetical protein
MLSTLRILKNLFFHSHWQFIEEFGFFFRERATLAKREEIFDMIPEITMSMGCETIDTNAKSGRMIPIIK